MEAAYLSAKAANSGTAVTVVGLFLCAFLLLVQYFSPDSLLGSADGFI